MWHEDIPIHKHEDESGKHSQIKIISGNFANIPGPAPAPDSWAADPSHEVQIWLVHMEPGAKLTLPKSSSGINRTLFYYKGESIEIDGNSISVSHGMDLSADVAVNLVNGGKSSSFLFLQGKPLNEKVVQHGPFVMNSNDEIQAAVGEFQRTQFGGWPWPEYEHTHAKDRGRFAIHADGREEVK